MTLEDKHRLFRQVKLTISDLETILQLVSDSRYLHFKLGDQSKVTDLDKLAQKIKQTIEKESSMTKR